MHDVPFLCLPCILFGIACTLIAHYLSFSLFFGYKSVTFPFRFFPLPIDVIPGVLPGPPGACSFSPFSPPHFPRQTPPLPTLRHRGSFEARNVFFLLFFFLSFYCGLMKVRISFFFLLTCARLFSFFGSGRLCLVKNLFPFPNVRRIFTWCLPAPLTSFSSASPSL